MVFSETFDNLGFAILVRIRVLRNVGATLNPFAANNLLALVQGGHIASSHSYFEDVAY